MLWAPAFYCIAHLIATANGSELHEKSSKDALDAAKTEEIAVPKAPASKAATASLPARRLLADLSYPEQKILAEAILEIVDEKLLAHHKHLNHEDESFFWGHRKYIRDFEERLTKKGLGRFVPLPVWDGYKPISGPFTVSRLDTARGMYEMRAWKPLRYPEVCQYKTFREFFDRFQPWHNAIHQELKKGGGWFNPLVDKPPPELERLEELPLFWPLHAYFVDLYDRWQTCPGVESADPKHPRSGSPPNLGG